MEYILVSVSSRYSPEELLRKLWKIPWRSFALTILQILDLKLYKNVILLWMFLYKFWKFLRAALPLKTLWDHLWVKSIYYIKKYLQNTSKTLLKTSAYILKIISLTVTSHSHKFSENFQSVFLFPNKEQRKLFYNKEKCFVLGRSNWCFYLCPALFYFF